MAASLVESMAADFEPEQFTDSYREAVIELIDAKLDRGESAELPATEKKPAAGKAGEVIDLLTALQRSVDRARSGGGSDTEAEPDGARATAAKKAPAKKSAPEKKAAGKKSAPAKKAAAKKTPAKKAAAKSA
jgi:DNA end-binding protein Ku